jgi:hypothetical protein
MKSGDWRNELPKRVTVMRIIVAAMVAGCTLVLTVLLVVSASFTAMPDMAWMTILAVGVAIAALIARAIIPAVVVAGGRKAILGELRKKAEQERDGRVPAGFEAMEAEAGHRLIGLLQAKTIMSVAPLEGAAFLLFIAYLLARSPIALAVGVAMIVILALHFPSVERTANWIEDQLRLLREEY